MRLKECSLIQELLPLYAEKLVNVETASYIEEHLATCTSCASEWESFTMPLPDPLMVGITSDKHIESRLVGRLRKTVALIALCIILGGAGLAYASFTAGRHIGINDPVYRFAQELSLFTNIGQTKKVDGVQVTLDKGLFDSTRSVLFISLDDSIKTTPKADLIGDTGQRYEQRRGKSWDNRYFMLEFEPIQLETEELSLSFSLSEAEGTPTEFTFPVDVLKTAQYTKIVYPNQKVELDELKINLEKAILGVSETECKVRFDWPVDGSVAGLGIGRGSAYFPTSVKKVSDTAPPFGGEILSPGGLLPGYAASFQEFYHPQDLSVNRPALYDLTERKEVEALGAEYSTTQFSCQVEAILKFAPVEQESQQLELLLPPIYLYKEVIDSPELYLNLQETDELVLETSISLAQGELFIDKAWLDDGALYLSYSLEPSTNFETMLPHFQLTDINDQRQGQMVFDRENPQVIVFYLFDEKTAEFKLKLNSVGKLVSREKFALELR